MRQSRSSTRRASEQRSHLALFFCVHFLPSSLLKEGDEVGDLLPFKFTFLHHGLRILSWRSCCYFRLWHSGDLGHFLCCLLLPPFQPKRGISLFVLSLYSDHVLQFLLSHFHQKEVCGGIPPVYFPVEVSPQVVIFLLNTCFVQISLSVIKYNQFIGSVCHFSGNSQKCSMHNLFRSAQNNMPGVHINQVSVRLGSTVPNFF